MIPPFTEDQMRTLAALEAASMVAFAEANFSDAARIEDAAAGMEDAECL